MGGAEVEILKGVGILEMWPDVQDACRLKSWALENVEVQESTPLFEMVYVNLMVEWEEFK